MPLGDREASLSGGLSRPHADPLARLEVKALHAGLDGAHPVQARVVLVAFSNVGAGVHTVLAGAVGVTRLGPLEVWPCLALVLRVQALVLDARRSTPDTRQC